jgi:tetratricopeptide (TPR) repeat protein
MIRWITVIFFFIASPILVSNLPALLAQQQPPAAKESAQSLLESAKQHIVEKRYRVAEKLLEKIKKIDPENPEVYSLSGDMHLIIGEYDLAESDFLVAIELSKRKDREYFRLGQVYLLKKDAKKAIAAFGSAINENPTLHISRFYLGMVYLKLERNKEKTIEQWEKYRSMVPDDPQGPDIDRAIALLRQKDFVLPPPEKEIGGDMQKLLQLQQQLQILQQNGVPMALPQSGSYYVPSIEANPEKEKSKSEGEGIIELDDL